MPEVRATVGDDTYQRWCEVLDRIGRQHGVRSVSSAVDVLIGSFNGSTFTPSTNRGWVKVESLFGDAMPPDVADVVRASLAKMSASGDIDHPWRALEWWAADHLAGP